MSDKLKTVFYEQQNYFEKMMGIMLDINRNAKNCASYHGFFRNSGVPDCRWSRSFLKESGFGHRIKSQCD